MEVERWITSLDVASLDLPRLMIEANLFVNSASEPSRPLLTKSIMQWYSWIGRSIEMKWSECSRPSGCSAAEFRSDRGVSSCGSCSSPWKGRTWSFSVCVLHRKSRCQGLKIIAPFPNPHLHCQFTWIEKILLEIFEILQLELLCLGQFLGFLWNSSGSLWLGSGLVFAQHAEHLVSNDHHAGICKNDNRAWMLFREEWTDFPLRANPWVHRLGPLQSCSLPASRSAIIHSFMPLSSTLWVLE